MTDRTFTIAIDRPPEEVFAYVTDPHKTGEWAPRVASVRVEPPGELAVGSKIVQRVRSWFGTFEGTFEIAGIEPGVEVVYRTESAYFTGDVIYRVEPAGEGSKFIIREKGGSKGLLRLLQPWLARSSARGRERMLAVIKERLEASA
jgi:carbon monoxide dehydrogenase subunit G